MPTIHFPPLRALRSPYALIALAMLFWSTNWLLGRALRADVTPVSLAFWRWFTAALILLPFTARELWAGRALLRRHWKLLVALAVTGMALFHSLVYLALQHTTAINASLFNSTTPIVIVLFSWVFFRDRATLRQFAGISVSLLGVLAVVTRGDLSAIRELAFNPGDLWALLSILIISGYTVLLQKRPAGLSPLALLSSLTWLTVAMLLPVYLWEASTGPSFRFTPQTVGAVLYLGIVPSIGAYMLWLKGVSAVGPNRAGVFSHLHPFFTSIFAIALIGEALAGYHLAGFALILGGIYLATARRLLPWARRLAPSASGDAAPVAEGNARRG